MKPKTPRHYAETLLFAFANSGESARAAMLRKFTECQADTFEEAARMVEEQRTGLLTPAALTATADVLRKAAAYVRQSDQA